MKPDHRLAITGMRVTRVPLTLREPYAIAYQSIERFDNLIVELETQHGLVGLGVAAPDLDVTGETIEDTHAGLLHVEPLLHGEDGAGYVRLVEAVRDALPKAPSVRAAIDMALVDLISKSAGVPAWRLLGGYRERFPTSVTIGILSLADTLQAVERRVIKDGFSIIKVKGGANVEDDIARLRAVRQRFPYIELRFDANCGYHADEALHFARATVDCGISIYEQPVPRAELKQLGNIALATQMSVMADESMMNARDCFRLAQSIGKGHDGEQKMVDMINVKLMKVGGLEDAVQVNAVARTAGIETMVGCMDECELSIAASLAFALSRRNVTAVDLDGHLDLADDPTAGRCLKIAGGIMIPSEEPGLGLARLG